MIREGQKVLATGTLTTRYEFYLKKSLSTTLMYFRRQTLQSSRKKPLQSVIIKPDDYGRYSKNSNSNSCSFATVILVE